MNAITIINNNPVTNLSETVREYVLQFNTFLNKSAEAVLEMGRVVAEAKRNLGRKDDFRQFCAAIRLDHESSAISKLKTIGERYERLSQFKDVLPNAWTTLYYLARMSDDNFNQGIQQHLIHQTMTAAELKAIDPKIIKSKSKVNPVAEPAKLSEFDVAIPSNDLRVVVGDLYDSQKKVDLIAQLKAICFTFGVELIGNEGSV